ncbi:MAG: transporter substrate-binding domain-containing protein [Proteobacteria bacterium]|nr:transporter substrate-binding domain-containing protein [Pseudomonadota bacterium]
MFVRLLMFFCFVALSTLSAKSFSEKGEVITDSFLPANRIIHFTKDVLPEEMRNKVLTVAIYEEIPFVFPSEVPNVYTGISIDIWEKIARELGLSFKYMLVSKEEGMKGVAEGKYDVLLGAIPDFVQDDSARFDYTLPFYSAGIGIAISKDSFLRMVLNYFISWDFFKVVIGFSIFVILQTLTLWFFERKINPHYQGGFWRGIGNGLWWSAGIGALNEAGDVNTQTLWGRCIAVFWMLLALVMVNIFTGSIASELTIGKLSTNIQTVADLRKLNVLCLDEKSSKKFLKEHFVKFKTVSSLEEGFEFLQKNKGSALIYSEPMLKYMINTTSLPNIQFVHAGIVSQYYSIKVPRGSKLLYSLNQVILKLLNGEEIKNILSRYFGNVTDLRT